MIGSIPASPPRSPALQTHTALYNLLLAAAYWVFSEWGFQLATVHSNVSPLWPASGLAVGALYFGGYRLAPGIFAGAIAAHFFNHLDPASTVVIAAGNTGEAIAALWLLNRMRRLNGLLGQYTLPVWILVAATLSPTISATFGSLSMAYLHEPPATTSLSRMWLTWMCGDAIGILTLVPVLLSMQIPRLSMRWLFQFVALASLVLMICGCILVLPFGSACVFGAFALLIPACRWFGHAGCAMTCLVITLLLTSVAIFSPETMSGSALDAKAWTLSAMLIVLSITSLTIAGSYRRGYYLIPGTLFSVGWLTCGIVYYTLLSSATKVDEATFRDLVSDAESVVRERLATYVDALIAGAGIYLNSERLEHKEWRSYVTHLNLNERYPGINGIGFVFPFKEDELADYVAQIRKSTFKDFTIKEVPNVERPPADAMGYPHYIITYIEPLAMNRVALGLDVGSELNRQSAGQRARDTGEVAMTDRIILVQDGRERPGFLIYYPMYQPGLPLKTTAQRREAFTGWSYAPFITEEFLDGVLGTREKQIQFRIYDSPTIDSSSFVYASSSEAHRHDDHTFDHTSSLNLAGQTFSFGWYRGPQFQTQETASATIAATSLALGTCLLVGIVVNLQTTNRRTQRIVEARTEDLTQANQQLTKEVQERKKAEQIARQAKQAAEAANVAKSEFLATMSHEIRTPMNSVLGYSELLAGSHLSNEQQQWTNNIQSSGRSLLHIINDILDISKIEAHRLHLERIPLSLETCIQETCDSFNVLAGQKGISVRNETSGNLPSAVLGDPIRLRQIVSNLVSNAIKFTKHGSVTVSLQWQGDAKEGTATIRVSDTGIGVSPEKLSGLFEKFTQADSSTTRKFGGTGLGLAICKQLSELMGGRIHAQSVVNEGTTMTVEIPFQATEDQPQYTRPPFPTNTPGNESQPADVLLVDDNRTNQHLGMTILRRLGCNVTVANDGQEALNALTAKRYPIVFLDCQMPVMDGYQATTEIRRLEAGNEFPTLSSQRPVTIVALTADASAEAREICLKVGMDDYLSKPFRRRDIQEVLHKYKDRT